MRLDIKLSQVAQISRSQAVKLINGGLVKINDEICQKISFLVSEADIISYTIPNEKPHDIEPMNLSLKIVFEDEHLAIIDKPAGISTHPGVGDDKTTLINGLLYHFKNLSDINNTDNIIRPGIVHRLDKETSGLMIIAKNNKAHELLSNMIADRLVKRTYTAVVYGKLKHYEGEIATNLRRNRNDRTKMEICSQSDGKIAITNYKVERILAGGLLSVVECKLQTGRTHQIRVHLTNFGNSIVGDKKYGTKTTREIDVIFKKHPQLASYIKNINRHLLHSCKLELIHPITAKNLSFESQMNDLQNLQNIL